MAAAGEGAFELVTLKRRAEFLAIRGGSRASTPGFLMEARLRPVRPEEEPLESPPRFGFTVTRKLGNAVKRNRIRRRLREAVRLALRQGLPRAGMDYVILAREALLTRDFLDIETDLRLALETVHKGPPGKDGPRRPGRPRSEVAARSERRAARAGGSG